MNFDEWWKEYRKAPDHWVQCDRDVARVAWYAAQEQLDPETMSIHCGKYMAQFRDKELPDA